ncbi:MAG: hypothetical protein CMF27_04995 [Kiritimatiellaceae bacterium]|nr:hypothetical protein [Kiritimatiellaceae bacterium]
MPKVEEQGRVRAHRWRDSIFVQLVIRYPRSARLLLLVLVLSISYRIWGIGSYLLAQRARVQVIESIRADEPNRFEEAQQIRKKLDQIIQNTQAFPCAEEVALEASLAKRCSEWQRDAEQALSLFTEMAKRDVLDPERVADFSWICARSAAWSLLVEKYEHALDWLVRGETWRLTMDLAMPEEAMRAWEALRKEIMGLASMQIYVPAVVREVIVWPLMDDGARRVQSDPILRTDQYPIKCEGVRSGSYLIWAALPDAGYQAYPVQIDRHSSVEVELTLPGVVLNEWKYVPAGNFLSGGSASGSVRLHSVSLPAFYISQDEVTIGSYLEFWSSIEDVELKEEWAAYYSDSTQERVMLWDNEGGLQLPALSLAHPIIGITGEAAEAYCRWKSRKMGRVIRLPYDVEWEKAARGVDGREYCWGNGLEDVASFFNVGGFSGQGIDFMEPVGSRLRDASIYTVRDMVGNVREITLSSSVGEGRSFGVKGSSGINSLEVSACARVEAFEKRSKDVGFRIVMENIN